MLKKLMYHSLYPLRYTVRLIKFVRQKLLWYIYFLNFIVILGWAWFCVNIFEKYFRVCTILIFLFFFFAKFGRTVCWLIYKISINLYSLWIQPMKKKNWKYLYIKYAENWFHLKKKSVKLSCQWYDFVPFKIHHQNMSKIIYKIYFS